MSSGSDTYPSLLSLMEVNRIIDRSPKYRRSAAAVRRVVRSGRPATVVMTDRSSHARRLALHTTCPARRAASGETRQSMVAQDLLSPASSLMAAVLAVRDTCHGRRIFARGYAIADLPRFRACASVDAHAAAPRP